MALLRTPYAKENEIRNVSSTDVNVRYAQSTAYFRSVVEHEMKKRTIRLLGDGVCPCARLLHKQQRSDAL